MNFSNSTGAAAKLMCKGWTRGSALLKYGITHGAVVVDQEIEKFKGATSAAGTAVTAATSARSASSYSSYRSYSS